MDSPLPHAARAPSPPPFDAAPRSPESGTERTTRSHGRAPRAGNNVQSLGLHSLAELDLQDREAAEQRGEEPPPPRDPSESRIWRVGTSVFVSGALLNFASYAFAPSSMLAPLEAIQFVTNIFFSKFMLKKRITNKMYAGTFLICLGTVAAVIFCTKAALCAKPKDLKNFYANTVYQVFLAFCVGSAVGLYFLHRAYERAAAAGAPLPLSNVVLPVTYAAFSAIFGTQSVVQAKCLSVILVYYGRNDALAFWRCFLNYFTYITLFAWLAFVSIWLFRMNEALGLYDPIFIIPLLQVDFILFAIVGGGIYFQEFDAFTTEAWIGFSVGIVMICAGLFMLAPPEEGMVPKNKIAPLQRTRPADSPPRKSNSSVANESDDDPNIVTLPKTEASPVTVVLNPTQTFDAASKKPRTRTPALDLGRASSLPPSPTTGGKESPNAKSLPSSGSERRSVRNSGRLHLNTRRLSYVTSVATQYNINELDSARQRGSARRRRSLTAVESGQSAGSLGPLVGSPGRDGNASTLGPGSRPPPPLASATPLFPGAGAGDGAKDDTELNDVLHDLNGAFNSVGTPGGPPPKEDPSMCTI